MRSVGNWLGGLVKYMGDNYDNLPSSVKEIVVDYWGHPEKDKDKIER